MEQVVADESTLETELKSYEDQVSSVHWSRDLVQSVWYISHHCYVVQLELVEQQLQVSGQEEDEGLLQLKADLAELIGLTQGAVCTCVHGYCLYACVCIVMA